MRIYVASSWRNSYQPDVVLRLRLAGHEVYDFRNPAPGNYGFAWSAIDLAWTEWTPTEFRSALSHPVAEEGYKFDIEALQWADATVLVLPCGRSAHLELGYAVGSCQRTFVFMPPEAGPQEPELMYKMCSGIACSFAELADLCEPPCEPGCNECSDLDRWVGSNRAALLAALRLAAARPTDADYEKAWNALTRLGDPLHRRNLHRDGWDAALSAIASIAAAPEAGDGQ